MKRLAPILAACLASAAAAQDFSAASEASSRPETSAPPASPSSLLVAVVASCIAPRPVRGSSLPRRFRRRGLAQRRGEVRALR